MSRRFALFQCEGNQLVGTLDPAAATTGLLIVSGGNELRAGPWGSQAQIAERVAAAGFPVFRFDRRGVGDSEGPNGGFETTAPDIAAAISAFRAHVPTLRRVVAFGNCDGASALMLAGGAGAAALVLANPWTFDPEPEPAAEQPAAPEPAPLPPSALRAHYLRRLTDPKALWRLLTGKVKVGQLGQQPGRSRAIGRPAHRLGRADGGWACGLSRISHNPAGRPRPHCASVPCQLGQDRSAPADLSRCQPQLCRTASADLAAGAVAGRLARR